MASLPCGPILVLVVPVAQSAGPGPRLRCICCSFRRKCLAEDSELSPDLLNDPEVGFEDELRDRPSIQKISARKES